MIDISNDPWYYNRYEAKTHRLVTVAKEETADALNREFDRLPRKTKKAMTRQMLTLVYLNLVFEEFVRALDVAFPPEDV